MAQSKATPQFKRQMLKGSAALKIKKKGMFAKFDAICITRDKDKLLVTASYGNDAIFTFDPTEVYDTQSLTISGFDAHIKLDIA